MAKLAMNSRVFQALLLAGTTLAIAAFAHPVLVQNVVENPTTSQPIVQPTGLLTTLSVNNFKLLVIRQQSAFRSQDVAGSLLSWR